MKNTLNWNNVVTWGCRLFVSAIFIYAGINKLVHPTLYPWMEIYPNLSLFSSIVDISVGIALILFPVLKHDKLSSLAAFGVIAMMSGAILLHVMRGEAHLIGINIFLLLLGLFITYIQHFTTKTK